MGGQPSKDQSVTDHLRDQAKFIKKIQEYLQKLEKMFLEWEKSHRAMSRAIDSFFLPGSTYRDPAVGIIQRMKIFEQARLDLQPQIVAVERTAADLLKKAKSLERLMKERDELSRKVTSCSQRVDKLKKKEMRNPTPKLQSNVQEAETKLNAVTSQFKLKELEAQFETSNAMNSKFLDASVLVNRSVLIAVHFLRLTAPEMEKAEPFLNLLQQSQSVTTPGTPAAGGEGHGGSSSSPSHHQQGGGTQGGPILLPSQKSASSIQLDHMNMNPPLNLNSTPMHAASATASPLPLPPSSSSFSPPPQPPPFLPSSPNSRDISGGGGGDYLHCHTSPQPQQSSSSSSCYAAGSVGGVNGNGDVLPMNHHSCCASPSSSASQQLSSSSSTLPPSSAAAACPGNTPPLRYQENNTPTSSGNSHHLPAAAGGGRHISSPPSPSPPHTHHSNNGNAAGNLLLSGSPSPPPASSPYIRMASSSSSSSHQASQQPQQQHQDPASMGVYTTPDVNSGHERSLRGRPSPSTGDPGVAAPLLSFSPAYPQSSSSSNSTSTNAEQHAGMNSSPQMQQEQQGGMCMMNGAEPTVPSPAHLPPPPSSSERKNPFDSD